MIIPNQKNIHMFSNSSGNTNYFDLFISLYKAERGLIEKIILDFFSLRERCIIRSYITPMTRAEMGIMAAGERDYIFLEELYSSWNPEGSDLGLRFDGFREIHESSSIDGPDVGAISNYELPAWNRICETYRTRDSIDIHMLFDLFSCSFYLESVLQNKNREMMMAFIRADESFDYISEFFCSASAMTPDIFKWCLEILDGETDYLDDIEYYELALSYGNIDCVKCYEEICGYNVHDISDDRLYYIFLRTNGDIVRFLIRNGRMKEHEIRKYCELPGAARIFHLEGMLPESFSVTKVDTPEDIEWVTQHGGTFSCSCLYRAHCDDKFDMVRDRKEILNFENITEIWNNYEDRGIFTRDHPDDIFMVSIGDSSSKIIEFQDGLHKKNACHIIEDGIQCCHSRESGKIFCRKHSQLNL